MSTSAPSVGAFLSQQRGYGVAAVVEDPAQVAAHERDVGERAQGSVRDRVSHTVGEQCAAVDGLEVVRVLPHCIWTADLEVDEMGRRLPDADLRRPPDGDAV